MIDFEWRPMRSSDIPSLLGIADKCHPKLPERAFVFEEKLSLYPLGCRTLVRFAQSAAPRAASEEKSLAGYLFSHPWYADEIPALDTLLENIPPLTNTYYLHDLALLPEARGKGLATCAARFANNLAVQKGFNLLALVAVNQSEAFWRKVGYEWVLRPNLVDTLASYGDNARYMLRTSGSSYS